MQPGDGAMILIDQTETLLWPKVDKTPRKLTRQRQREIASSL